MSERKTLQLARAELALLERQRALPPHCSVNPRLDDQWTVLKDINGALALLRVALLSEGGERIGYADIATAPELGSLLFSVTRGRVWDELAIRGSAERHGLASDGEFVAYAYPKVGLEVARDGDRRSVFDWIREEVVDLDDSSSSSDPLVAKPYSMLGSLPEALRIANTIQYRALERILLDGDESRTAGAVLKAEQKEIRYSQRAGSHPCFELRTQDAHEWCVPACVEMILAFYRYEYRQDEIADALGQEDGNGNESELPTGKEYKVVEVLSFLTCDALEARIYPCEGAFWEVIRQEIGANRPLILFTGGHARIVTGYSVCDVHQFLCRSLSLYDPLEVEVCWEYYNPTRELVLFSAQLRATTSR